MAQELKVYRDPKEGPCWREFYEKSDVDAVLAEKDMEIFNLKKELSYIKEDSTFDRDKHKDLLKSKDEEIRRLQRALWLTRAERANAEWGHWATIWFCDTGAILNINKSSVSQDPYRCTITRNAAEWRNLWAEVERTCRAMAERFKD